MRLAFLARRKGWRFSREERDVREAIVWSRARASGGCASTSTAHFQKDSREKKAATHGRIKPIVYKYVRFKTVAGSGVAARTPSRGADLKAEKGADRRIAAPAPASPSPGNHFCSLAPVPCDSLQLLPCLKGGVGEEEKQVRQLQLLLLLASPLSPVEGDGEATPAGAARPPLCRRRCPPGSVLLVLSERDPTSAADLVVVVERSEPRKLSG